MWALSYSLLDCLLWGKPVAMPWGHSNIYEEAPHGMHEDSCNSHFGPRFSWPGQGFKWLGSQQTSWLQLHRRLWARTSQLSSSNFVEGRVSSQRSVKTKLYWGLRRFRSHQYHCSSFVCLIHWGASRGPTSHSRVPNRGQGPTFSTFL